MIIGLNATLETDFCALDSNDAWNGFQGGTLDSPSLSQNVSLRVKLYNSSLHVAVFTLAVLIFVISEGLGGL